MGGSEYGTDTFDKVDIAVRWHYLCSLVLF